ncbi:hypothetical protein ACHAQJ_001005 [Trichoderma viride]
MRPDSNEFQQLQNQLRTLLPRYMVPRIFVTVSRLPLSISDKIDFKLLSTIYTEGVAEPSSSAQLGSKLQINMTPAECGHLVSSSSQLSIKEAILRDIWASAVPCSKELIQPQDDIFDLGADSPSIIKVAMLARKEGYILSVAEIYTSPVLSQMANLLSGSHPTTAPVNGAQDIPPFSLLSAATRETLGENASTGSDIVDVLPCSYFQTTALMQGQKRHKAYYAWFLVRIKGPMDLDRRQAACNILIRRHAALRASYRVVGGEFVKQIHRPTHTVSDFQHLGSCASEEAFVALLDHKVPSPVSFGRILTRFRIASYHGDEDGGHILGLGMSHAQYDGFWWTRIFEDLYDAYFAGTVHDQANRPSPLGRFISHSIKTSLDYKTESFCIKLLNGAKMTSIAHLEQ